MPNPKKPRPICKRPDCDNPVKKIVNKYCSNSCAQRCRDKSTFKGFASKSGQEKSRKTMAEKYGVEYPTQMPDNRSFRNYKQWEVIDPNGKSHQVQGYERYVFPILWKQSIDIVTSRAEVPEIFYSDPTSSRRRYFTDAYCSKEKSCIEVKSIWTIRTDKRLEYKIREVIDRGMTLRLIVWDKYKKTFKHDHTFRDKKTIRSTLEKIISDCRGESNV